MVYQELFSNVNSFFLINAIIAFFLLQKIVTLDRTQQHYFLILVVALAFVIYYSYKSYKNKFLHKNEIQDSFVQHMIKLTLRNDKTLAYPKRKYHLAFTLMKSDIVLTSMLRKIHFHHSVHLKKSYRQILYHITRFYEDYGEYLDVKKQKRNRKIGNDKIIEDMIGKRQFIMNSIQELILQAPISFSKEAKSKELSIVVLACLDKCIRVLRNKYKSFHSSAPYAFNLMGDEWQLF